MQAAIDKVLNDAVKSGAVPNVTAAVSKDGKIIYNGAAGTKKLNGEGGAVAPNTPSRIMSMTKFLTSVGLLQLVEQGKVNPDAPITDYLPELKGCELLKGFDADGKPITEAPKRAPTVKEVMSHSSGYSYDFIVADHAKYNEAKGLPSIFAQRRAGIHGQPLLFHPGEDWMYSTGIDMGGFVIEKVTGQTLGEYLKKNVFDVLGMKDTFFGQHADDHEHHVPIHLRQPDEAGTLVHLPMPPAEGADFEMGGGGLTSTNLDYLAFLNDLLSPQPKLLSKETISKYVSSNNLPDGVKVKVLPANYPYLDERSFIPGEKVGHSMACAINEDHKDGFRAEGSLTWAGLLNSYFWADPKNGVAGVIMTQILPFADRKVVPLLEEFEKAVYANLA